MKLPVNPTLANVSPDLMRLIGKVAGQVNAITEGQAAAFHNAATAAPTTGTWNIADVVKNSAPVEAGAPGSAYVITGWIMRTATETDDASWPTLTTTEDQRRTCDQCANLARRRCLAAWRGEIVASRDYEPVRDIPRRCEGYAPGADDPDTRPGRERWPELIQKEGE